MDSIFLEADLDIFHEPLELKSNVDMLRKVSYAVSGCSEVFVSVVVASFRNPTAAVE
jgi:hypothetical protein